VGTIKKSGAAIYEITLRSSMRGSLLKLSSLLGRFSANAQNAPPFPLLVELPFERGKAGQSFPLEQGEKCATAG
jgi:hypothetical protein